MNQVPIALLGLVIMLIMLTGLAAWVLLRTSKEEQGMKDRIAAISAAGQPKASIALPSITKKDADKKLDWRDVLAGIFGFSMAKTELYSMAWPWVVIIGLVAGRIAVWLGSGLFGSLAWVLLPVVAIGISRQQFGSMLTKRKNKLRVQLPDAIGLIVRAVRVGVPVTEALRGVARECPVPTSTEFGRLVDELAMGAALEKALKDMSDRNELPEYGFFAAALSLQAQTGGGLAETLELLADVARKRVAMQARGFALSSEARTSSMILAGLPFVTGGALYLANPTYIGILFTDPSGQTVLGVAILSLCTGIFTMRMIIRSALTT
jgi:tight adherence protein B